MRIGLTGGVGSGKSTVAALLAERGAVVIDADQLAREVVRRGAPGFEPVVARFGRRVLGPDGQLDRSALAAIVFADPDARHDLEAIVHPLVGARAQELMGRAGPHAIVVYDVPLIVENGLASGFDTVVVVEAPRALRLARLADRGLSPEQAEARMATQASDEQRRAVADHVLVNDGTLESLAHAVDGLWSGLKASSAIG